MAYQKFYRPALTPYLYSAEWNGVPVTPADGTDLPNLPCDAIYVTGAGNVNINLVGGGTAVLTGLSAGQIVNVQASRILATSTTATGIFALYLGQP